MPYWRAEAVGHSSNNQRHGTEARMRSNLSCACGLHQVGTFCEPRVSSSTGRPRPVRACPSAQRPSVEYKKLFFTSQHLLNIRRVPARVFLFIVTVGRFMHILPAGLWSVIAPMQLSPTFRSKHRTAHRRMGRLFIAMSVSMSIGIVPIVIRGANKLDEQTVRFGGERQEPSSLCIKNLSWNLSATILFFEDHWRYRLLNDAGLRVTFTLPTTCWSQEGKRNYCAPFTISWPIY